MCQDVIRTSVLVRQNSLKCSKIIIQWWEFPACDFSPLKTSSNVFLCCMNMPLWVQEDVWLIDLKTHLFCCKANALLSLALIILVLFFKYSLIYIIWIQLLLSDPGNSCGFDSNVCLIDLAALTNRPLPFHQVPFHTISSWSPREPWFKFIYFLRVITQQNANQALRRCINNEFAKSKWGFYRMWDGHKLR